jgi:large subunit ribosomal protein L16
MLQPKKRKYNKEFRGKMNGISLRGSEVSYGEAVANFTDRKGKLWVKIFPHKPVTKKSDEVVRGGGKGPVDHFVAVVRPGLVLFEIGGLPEATCKEALERAARKISLKTRIVSKHVTF